MPSSSRFWERSFDGHLVKPLDPKSLKDLFAQIAAQRSARESPRRDIIEP